MLTLLIVAQAPRKVRKEKIITSSPGRKVGRGPGRPPKHSRDKGGDRVEHEGGSNSGDIMTLKVCCILSLSLSHTHTHTQNKHSHHSNNTIWHPLLPCHQTINSVSSNRFVGLYLEELEDCVPGDHNHIYNRIYFNQKPHVYIPPSLSSRDSTTDQ